MILNKKTTNDTLITPELLVPAGDFECVKARFKMELIAFILEQAILVLEQVLKIFL